MQMNLAGVEINKVHELFPGKIRLMELSSIAFRLAYFDYRIFG